MPDLTLEQQVKRVFSRQPAKIILHAPRPGEKAKRAILTRHGGGWQLETLRGAQAFHQNLVDDTAAAAAVAALLETGFTQLTARAADGEHSLRVTKKGRVLANRYGKGSASLGPKAGNQTTAASPQQKADAGAEAGDTPTADTPHDRPKNHLLAGRIVPPLVDMGVLTPDGWVAKAMGDKYRQINRFAELVDDALRPAPPKALRVVDFGCGKSYLTFVLYYLLRDMRGIDVEMTGLDLKADVVAGCNAAAKKYGYDTLHFEVGDIAGYGAQEQAASSIREEVETTAPGEHGAEKDTGGTTGTA